ncbi:MAG: cell division protein FtsQ/DivIB [Saccharospirillum sp.]|uniref:cell division protein FtsQ/DivIB n=1 Tax=Saccharospirillum sp. TaxID=2033801 RepID=UPI0032986368
MTEHKRRGQGAVPRKPSKPPRNWRRALRLSAQALAGGLAVAVLVVGGRWVTEQDVSLDWRPMAVTTWQVDELLVYEDRNRLDTAMEAFRGRSLLTIAPGEVQQRLEQLPWIAEVSVTKAWPDRLQLAVTEHEPVARWNGDQVLNSDGEPLSRPVAELVLAELSGPDAQAKRVMEQYLQFSRVFSGAGQRLNGVEMHRRGAWTLTLDSGIEVALGSKDMLARTRRVVVLLNAEGVAPGTIEYIDARYPNGLAVGHRASSEPSV